MAKIKKKPFLKKKVDDVVVLVDPVPQPIPPAPLVKISPEPCGGVREENLNGIVIMWRGVTEHSVLTEFECKGYACKSVDLSGEFGGGTISILGGNCPGNPVYSPLEDSEGYELVALGKPQVQSVSPHTYFIKPERAGGKGMNITITMFLYNTK